MIFTHLKTHVKFIYIFLLIQIFPLKFEKSPVTRLLGDQTKSRRWSCFKVNSSTVQTVAGRMVTLSSWVIGWGESLKIWIALNTVLVNKSRGKRIHLDWTRFWQVMSGCPYFEKRHLYVHILHKAFEDFLPLFIKFLYNHIDVAYLKFITTPDNV